MQATPAQIAWTQGHDAALAGTQILDPETKAALLSAVDRRMSALVSEANALLQQADRDEAAGDLRRAAESRRLAEVIAGRATILRHFWNDAKPREVRISLTR
jgi:hypothetical protein